MAVGYNPRVVTDGLVSVLDAQNSKSWKSGTTWTDTFGGNNGTLTGGTSHSDGPFPEAGYVEFDGTGDRLSIAASTDFDIGSAKTWECWFKLNTVSTNELLMGSLSNHWLNIGFSGINGLANKVGFSILDGSWLAINSTTSIVAGSWYHVAVTWDGTYAKLYLNGVLESTSADWSAKTWASNNGNPYEISGYSGDDASSIDGSISNLRITDSVLYTSNFTPPSSPLTAVTNTKLLCCQGATNVDASPSAHSFGLPTLTSVGPSATKYFEFDGSNDYVILNDLDKASYGTTNFSLSLWFNADSGSYKSLFQVANSLDSHGPWIALISYSSGLRVYVNNDYRMNVPYTQDAWNNFVLTFDSSGSGLWTAYLNGSSVSTYTGPIGTNGGSATYLGHAYNNSYFDGKISNFLVQQKTLTAAEVEQNYNATKGRYA